VAIRISSESPYRQVVTWLRATITAGSVTGRCTAHPDRTDGAVSRL